MAQTETRAAFPPRSVAASPLLLERCSRLRENELVEYTPNSDLADGRYVMYQLTARGEKRQDDRFLGQLKDDPAFGACIAEEDDAIAEEDYEDVGYDYRQLRAQLT
jgi:hypothetical protein